MLSSTLKLIWPSLIGGSILLAWMWTGHHPFEKAGILFIISMLAMHAMWLVISSLRRGPERLRRAWRPIRSLLFNGLCAGLCVIAAISYSSGIRVCVVNQSHRDLSSLTLDLNGESLQTGPLRHGEETTFWGAVTRDGHLVLRSPDLSEDGQALQVIVAGYVTTGMGLFVRRVSIMPKNIVVSEYFNESRNHSWHTEIEPPSVSR